MFFSDIDTDFLTKRQIYSDTTFYLSKTPGFNFDMRASILDSF